MGDDILWKIFEHNLWSNLQVVQACTTLGKDQLEAEPRSATRGNIRQTLVHIAEAEEYYLSLLLGRPERVLWQAPAKLVEIREALQFTGQALLGLVRGAETSSMHRQIRLSDGWKIEAWLLILQAINHATEHREQIKSMLSALGVTPPEIDGWAYGTVANAAIPPSS